MLKLQISKLGVLGIPAFKACNSCLDEFGDVVGGKFWFGMCENMLLCDSMTFYIILMQCLCLLKLLQLFH